MLLTNRRKYVYENPNLNVSNKQYKNDLKIFDNYDISDEEAMLKANKLTVEEQNSTLKLRRSHFGKRFNEHCHSRTNRSESKASTIDFTSVDKKGNRVPGLYGCNRWKSKEIACVRETESFCFF
ncbi:hypothetical protein ACEV76_18980 [Vibrio parahaemolyticus]|uniref:hypothetical protein n=1 Tax=Vibrio vulnificus TaxID=672 RepID=UPI0007EE436D|nr:hypothetical protein [Vibrio vulnificus]ANN26685.1 hypothetical protein FORC17_1622 [Vibrio vulnificus]HAS6021547.1 hypothetical protein [Vibrio vulnificus]HDY7492171.1 hypothetical protein [Vibrio vulnificus]HDY8024130.1 hypothetical protein [Vibrio vulnificus]HDY8029361.1 hypothetical protein [Vibrio vulnificus]